jgi:hypothetical protein
VKTETQRRVPIVGELERKPIIGSKENIHGIERRQIRRTDRNIELGDAAWLSIHVRRVENDRAGEGRGGNETRRGQNG